MTRFSGGGEGNNVQEGEQIACKDSVALSTENGGRGTRGWNSGGGGGGARGMIEEPEVEDVVPSQ